MIKTRLLLGREAVANLVHKNQRYHLVNKGPLQSKLWFFQ